MDPLWEDMYNATKSNMSELDEACKTFATLYRGYRKAGLSAWEAACIIGVLLTVAMPEPPRDSNAS